MSDVEYVVKMGFTYNGKKYKPGDLWEPEGFKNDQTLISTDRFVTPVEKQAGSRRGKPLGSSAKPPENGKPGLKPRYRDALMWIMYYEEDLPYEHIAEVFGVAESTARAGISRENKRRK